MIDIDSYRPDIHVSAQVQPSYVTIKSRVDLQLTIAVMESRWHRMVLI